MKNSKMKIIASMCFFLILFLSKTDAQRTEFGMRFMPTFSSLDLQTSDGGNVKGDAKFGYGVGGFLGFNFTNQVGIQGEVIYSSNSQKYKEQDVEREIKLKYVNIPLLLSLNTGKTNPINFNISAGPQVGISVGNSIKTSGGDGSPLPEAVLSVKKGDLGVAYGAGFDFGLNPAKNIRLGLGYRGVRGLIDISDNNNTETTNSYYILDRTHIKSNAVYVGLSVLF